MFFWGGVERQNFSSNKKEKTGLVTYHTGSLPSQSSCHHHPALTSSTLIFDHSWAFDPGYRHMSSVKSAKRGGAWEN